jgi:aldose sugar dehydrogenase
VFEHGPRGSDLLHRVRCAAGITAGPSPHGPGVPHAGPVRQGVDEAQALMPEGTYIAEPVHEFVLTIAPSGLAVVVGGGSGTTPGRATCWAAGYARSDIVRMVLEDGELVHAEELLTQRIGRIRDVRMGPDGYIYIATDEEDGGIYRLEPVN